MTHHTFHQKQGYQTLVQEKGNCQHVAPAYAAYLPLTHKLAAPDSLAVEESVCNCGSKANPNSVIYFFFFLNLFSTFFKISNVGLLEVLKPKKSKTYKVRLKARMVNLLQYFS